MARSGVSLMREGQGRDSVKSACRELNLRLKILEELIDAELEQSGKLRKRGLTARLDEIFDEALDS